MHLRNYLLSVVKPLNFLFTSLLKEQQVLSKIPRPLSLPSNGIARLSSLWIISLYVEFFKNQQSKQVGHTFENWWPTILMSINNQTEPGTNIPPFALTPFQFNSIQFTGCRLGCRAWKLEALAKTTSDNSSKSASCKGSNQKFIVISLV